MFATITNAQWVGLGLVYLGVVLIKWGVRCVRSPATVTERRSD